MSGKWRSNAVSAPVVSPKYFDQELLALIPFPKQWVTEPVLRQHDMVWRGTEKHLQAYADGVNDFLAGVGYFNDEIIAFYLPVEFHVMGIK